MHQYELARIFELAVLEGLLMYPKNNSLEILCLKNLIIHCEENHQPIPESAKFLLDTQHTKIFFKHQLIKLATYGSDHENSNALFGLSCCFEQLIANPNLIGNGLRSYDIMDLINRGDFHTTGLHIAFCNSLMNPEIMGVNCLSPAEFKIMTSFPCTISWRLSQDLPNSHSKVKEMTVEWMNNKNNAEISNAEVSNELQAASDDNLAIIGLDKSENYSKVDVSDSA